LWKRLRLPSRAALRFVGELAEQESFSPSSRRLEQHALFDRRKYAALDRLIASI
jgi:hypothetical protein